jgi:hypothetical protein
MQRYRGAEMVQRRLSRADCAELIVQRRGGSEVMQSRCRCRVEQVQSRNRADTEVVQRRCRDDAEVVQRWCRGSAEGVQRWCTV